MMPPDLRDEVKNALVGLLGEHKVFWREADMVPYTKDTYRNRPEDDYRYFPDFVVLPETTDEVQGIVKVALEHKIPLLPKGGGSNRTGMLVPVAGGIVVDTIKMNRVLEVSPANLYVTVQPGITLKDLEEKLVEHGLALNQEQGSFKVATVGGSISTSGFSRRHQKYGVIADRVMSLEVVLGDGSVLRTGPKVLYTSTGYRLQQLFIGAEGTLGIITEATLRVEPLPEAKAHLAAFYDDYWAAERAAQRMMASGVTFVGGEAYEIVDASKWGAPASTRAAFYVILEGTEGEVKAEAEFISKIMTDEGGVMADKENTDKLVGKYTQQWCGARAITGFENAITTYIPMDKTKEFYDKLWNEVMPKCGLGSLPGERMCLDVGRYRLSGGRYKIPLTDEGYEGYKRALREIAKLANSLGGSMSGCHGVGLEHRDNMDVEYSDVALEVMWRVKKVFDPENIMNPGKKLPETRP